MKNSKIEHSRQLLLSSAAGSSRSIEGYDEEQINNVVKFLYGSELMARKPFVTKDLGVAELFKDFRGYVCRSCGVDQKLMEAELGAEFDEAGLGIAGPSMYGERDKLKGQLIGKMMTNAGGSSSNVVCYAVRGLYQYLQEEAKRGDSECGNMANEMQSIFPSGTYLDCFVASRDGFGFKDVTKFLPMLDVPSDVKEFMEGYELDLHTRSTRQFQAKAKTKDVPSGKAADAHAATAIAASRGWETKFFTR